MKRMSIQFFEGATHTKLYAQYRPSYPREVYRTIMDFCKEGGGNEFIVAVDVACGPGQSTLPLVDHFQNVIGMDISENQINLAPRDITNVDFRVGKAENLDFLQGNSVDLVTIATALHWTDQIKCFSEAKRVLKPGGCCAVYGYGKAQLDNPVVQKYYDEFFDDITKAYYSEEIDMAINHYKDVEMPFPSWRRCDQFAIVKELTVSDFLGYVFIIAVWPKYQADNPNTKIFEDLGSNIRHVYGETDNTDRRHIFSWPVFMLMGK